MHVPSSSGTAVGSGGSYCNCWLLIYALSTLVSHQTPCYSSWPCAQPSSCGPRAAPEHGAAGVVPQAQEVGAVKLLGSRKRVQALLDALQVRVGCSMAGSDK